MVALAWILGLDICPDITDIQAGDVVVTAMIPFITKEMAAIREKSL
ncbi:MAG: hypothetical protein ACI9E1_002191 [Cryomorphaceae bacterium]|jgi:hypothetical protein